jgi:capsular exopolysaccharide synthesis family protein
MREDTELARPDGPAGAARAAQSSAGALDDLVGLVSRQRWLIAGTVAAITGLAILAVSTMTPRYRAQALVLVGPQLNATGADSAVAGLAGDSQTIQSEAEILRSRGLAEQVVRQLELDRYSEFNPALRPRGWLAGLFGRPHAAAGMPAVVDEVLAHQEVAPRGESRVIAVGFVSESAELAALVANTLAELYVADRLRLKLDAARQASVWLDEQVQALRRRVAESERAVEDFRQQSGLLQSQGATLAAQELADLNARHAEARAVRRAAESRLRQVEKLIATPAGVESAGEVLGSSLIQRLKEQESVARREVAELESEYGPGHPRMIALRAQLAELQSKIESEVQKVVAGLRNEVEIARAEEQSVAASLGATKQRVGESNDAEIQLRLLLETMLSRLLETNPRKEGDGQQADARIVSRADPPSAPDSPMKLALICLSVFAATLLGLMLAYVREALDRGFRSGEQIEELTGLAPLGFVPKLGRRQLGRGVVAYAQEFPRSSFVEAIRNVKTRLDLARGKPFRSLLVTSTQPAEGKTTVAVVLAQALARAGHRTVLVDADCRRSSVHAALGLASVPGWVEVLGGAIDLQGALRREPASGLQVLTAGVAPADPLQLLESSGIRALIDRLAAEFEYVIVDSPPVMVASDAALLARMVDTTLLVVRWAGTTRRAVRLAVEQLTLASGRPGGALLTQVDVVQYARYGYGDSGRYAGKLAAYYGPR